MTDKEQIIIDVSNCMYLDGNYCPNHDTKCDFVDNCYFREYKRKEQECEELKKERMVLINKNNLLKAELNQIKLLLEGKNTQYNTLFKEIERLKREYWVLKQNTTITEKLSGDRYRKALEDIEGIIKQTKQQVFCQHCVWYNTDGCDPSDKICGDFIKILDIINKAKGEGNAT